MGVRRVTLRVIESLGIDVDVDVGVGFSLGLLIDSLPLDGSTSNILPTLEESYDRSTTTVMCSVGAGGPGWRETMRTASVPADLV